MKKNEPILLMDSGRIRRTLKRMVFQIAEKAGDRDILLIGMNEGGGALADEMGEYLKTAANRPVSIRHYTVTDDQHGATDVRSDNDLNGKMVIFVDDVIFGGKTMFSTLTHLIDDLDCIVFTAVLVDRGHRTLPVNAGFVGIDIATKLNEHVELILKDGRAEKVLLFKVNGAEVEAERL